MVVINEADEEVLDGDISRRNFPCWSREKVRVLPSDLWIISEGFFGRKIERDW